MKGNTVADKAIETDVVVVGYGGAGATAAITAHDHGAEVIVLEKMPAGGGNTCISGGAFLAPASNERVQDAIQYVEALGYGATEREVIQTFMESALETKDWIRQIGGEAVPFQPFKGVFYPRPPAGPNFSNIAGGEHLIRLIIKGNESDPWSKRLWNLLSTNVERRRIKVMTSTPAKELITNRKGEVVGVVADKGGKKLLVKAKRAVILTSGGFEYNEAMKEAFLPCKPFYASGSPSNTGDGIVMAQKVGAALWHMTAVAGYFAFKTPEFQAAFMLRYCSPGFIHVNRQGKRFCDETGRDYHDSWRDFSQVDSSEKTRHLCHPNIPAYGIFDEATRCKGSLYRMPNPSGYNRDLYEWSPDNSREIAKGWIKRGETIAELARQINVEESSLVETVARYNRCCKAGKDADLGRSRDTLAAIDMPPFYAIELWPGMLNTQGGPRRDKHAHLLNHEGKPIPRLYAAGELGSVWGFLYAGGGNIAECLAFGRIAGRNAAMEKE